MIAFLLAPAERLRADEDPRALALRAEARRTPLFRAEVTFLRRAGPRRAVVFRARFLAFFAFFFRFAMLFTQPIEI